MNERQAEQNGYSFTGHYSHDKEEQKTYAKMIREETGFKAIVVNTPPSKLSRGSHGMGYSVYAEKKYFLTRSLKDYEKCLAAISDRRVEAKAKYDELLTAISVDEQCCKERIDDLQKQLAS